ncbi:disulfide bond formation protein B [Candidatus Pelagibacter sp.]|jgi:disulfide bond formation protein DsbB|nr:disulfide bond formation protein B [Candidatus Pelagibacter sp.]
MDNLKKETYLKLLFLISFSVLLTAYAIQYLLGYEPCNLCLIERIPYALALIILILNFKFKKDQIFYSVLLTLVFIFSLLISIYHFGIEQGLLTQSNVCGSSNIGSLITKDAILNSLQEVAVNCKDVAFYIFGLSLTTYNILVSLVMFLISIKIYFINNDIKK